MNPILNGGYDMKQYQNMSTYECQTKLMDILDNKTKCQKFQKKSNQYNPTVHNMVRSIYFMSGIEIFLLYCSV